MNAARPPRLLHMHALRRASATSTRVALAAWIAVNCGRPLEASPLLRITEVMSKTHDSDPEPDWFELTNLGSSTFSVNGEKVDDGSFDAALAAVLQGVTTIAPGESVVFVESADALYPATFRTNWGLAESVQVGFYTGSGLSLSSGGDGLTVFNAANAELPGPSDGKIRVSFGVAPGGRSFYWGYAPSGRFGTNRAGTLTPTGDFSGLTSFTFATATGSATAYGTPGVSQVTAEPPIVTWGGSTGANNTNISWNTTFGSGSTAWVQGYGAEWASSAFTTSINLGRNIEAKDFDVGRTVTINPTANNFTVALSEGTVNVASAKTLILNAVLTGSAGLTKIGPGTMRVANTTYGGDTTVSSGILQLNSGSGSLPATTRLAVGLGASFDANGRTVTVASLEGLGDVNLGGNANATFTVGITDAADREFNGGLSGAASLVIDSTGLGEQGFSTRTATASKTKSYGGATTVQRGTLRLAADGVPDSTTGITVAAAGILKLSTGYDPTTNAGVYLVGAAGVNGNATSISLVGGMLRQSEGEGMRLENDVVVDPAAGGTINVVPENTVGAPNNARIWLTGALRGGGTLAVTGTGSVALGNFSANQQGQFAYSGPISGNPVDFAGTLAVAEGVSLAVHHAMPTASVALTGAAAVLGGNGIVAGITGAGTVSPGSSPGMLTAGTADLSGGADFTFEFTAAQPVWSTSGTGALNDVLRLTGTSPFAGTTATAANSVNLLFNMTTLAPGEYLGGFFVDGVDGFAAALAGAAVNVFVKGDGNGSAFAWEGVNYYTLDQYDPSLTATLDTVSVAAAGFEAGTVAGAVTRMTVAVPEPAAVAMAGAAFVSLMIVRLRRRAVHGSRA